MGQASTFLSVWQMLLVSSDRGISPLWKFILTFGRCPWGKRQLRQGRILLWQQPPCFLDANTLWSWTAWNYFHFAVRWHQHSAMATASSTWMNLPSVLLGHKVQDSIKHSGNDSYASLQSVRVYEEIAWWRMYSCSNLGPHTLSALQDFPSSSRVLHTPFLFPYRKG